MNNSSHYFQSKDLDQLQYLEHQSSNQYQFVLPITSYQNVSNTDVLNQFLKHFDHLAILLSHILSFMNYSIKQILLMQQLILYFSLPFLILLLFSQNINLYILYIILIL